MRRTAYRRMLSLRPIPAVPRPTPVGQLSAQSRHKRRLGFDPSPRWAARPPRRRCRPGHDRPCRSPHALATVLKASLTAGRRSPKPASGRGLKPFDARSGAMEPPDARAARPAPGAPPATGACAGDWSLRRGKQGDDVRPLPRMRQRSDRGMSQADGLRFVLGVT